MFAHLNAYDRALLNIREKLLLMSQIAGNSLAEAMKSLIDQDDLLAKTVIAGDDRIDILDEEVESESLEVISLQQPIDRDLRFLAAAMRISRELERIGDYACDIAEAALEIKQKASYFKPLVDLSRMAEIVQMMLSKSLKAYLEKDLKSARELDGDDETVDGLFLLLSNKLMDFMKKEPDYVDQSSISLLVARYLERIGDHAVNISEMTIFAETGERHPFKSPNSEKKA